MDILLADRKREAQDLLAQNIDVDMQKKTSVKNLPPKKIIEREARFPNQVYVYLRSIRNCELDIAVQLTLQPDRMEDDKVLMEQLQKTK